MNTQPAQTKAQTSDAAKSSAVAAQWLSHAPFYDHLGLQVVSIGDGSASLLLSPSTDLGNSKGDLHGGAIASMMDITLSQAVRSAYPSGINVSTISMTVNYLAPSQGNALSHAQVIRAGHSIAYAEGDVKNEAGDIVCRVSGSYRIIRPK
jgi:uncharacterized protein (TIGR00369 family)